MKNLTSIADHSDYLSASTYSGSERWELHRKRVRFGKQPLELWMFVACKLVDGIWVVLEKPYKALFDEDIKLCNLVKDYKQAKERCLFEGFELKGQTNYSFVYKNKNIFPYFISKKGTIEDLTFHISNCDLQLTPTALKQIGI